MKKFAVILCGSGFKDGTEIREAIATLHALSTIGAEFQCFAPDEDQSDVVNCLTGESVPGEKRNQRTEAARIARGDVQPLVELNPTQYSGLLIPGGFGAAKNLCSFAREGSKGTVHPQLARVLDQFYELKRPIGAICIAPAILGIHFRGKGIEMTLGQKSGASDELEKLGQFHRVASASECVIDEKHRVVTTPAYMEEAAPLKDIFQGIHRLVNAVAEMAPDWERR